MSVTLLAALILSFLNNQPLPDLSPSEFKQIVLDRWKEISTKSKATRTQVEHLFLKAESDEPYRTTRKDAIRQCFSPAGNLFWFTLEHFDDKMAVTDREDEMQIVNHQYRATLKKAKGKDQWILVKHEDASWPTAEGQFNATTCPWLVCGNVFLPDWFASDSFVIVRIERPVVGRVGLVRAHFEHDPNRQSYQPERAHIKSGFIDFDAGQYYRVGGFQFLIKTKQAEYTENGQLEYTSAKGIPILKEKTEERPRLKIDSKMLRSKEVYIYSIQPDADISEKEFRLSYYGLPEPIGVEWKRSTPIYLWIMAAAVVSAMLAIGFRWLAIRGRPVN